MRFTSAQLDAVLGGSGDHYWSADLLYDGERRLQDIPITDPRLREDGGAKIQQSGSCSVVWQDTFGASMTPRMITDAFAPFGAKLRVYSNVVAGPFRERVAFGVFDITDVPSARDESMAFRGRTITTGSTIELEFKEQLAGVQGDDFDVPTSPSLLASAWDELGRISGMQLVRAVEDKPITRTILYPESRLDAIYDLCDVILDAIPHTTADGALAARPKVWPAAVARLRRGPRGQLVKVGDAMSPSGVYNRVVVRATGSDQTSILAIAELTSGPLRVKNLDGSRSPFGQRTRYLSSEFVTTRDQAQAWAESTLAQVSVPRARVLPVEMTFDPRLERGDVVEIERPGGEVLTGRIVSIDRSARATQQLTVEVP
ncbi:hypothetical protein ACFVTX_18230 [Agromyces sp. NPDC058136]|uniref:hypothetical protein n=1 Tax=Agromyces sp. NPDC058136 TaxID=3346354 RepID=UPI0036D77C09